jgi:chromosome segregation ATPase
MQIALKFDPRVTKAMKEVFGRKLLVRDQSAAESFSGSAGMDCVTMEGDEVGRKGGITGITNYNTTTNSTATAIYVECASTATITTAAATDAASAISTTAAITAATASTTAATVITTVSANAATSATVIIVTATGRTNAASQVVSVLLLQLVSMRF